MIKLLLIDDEEELVTTLKERLVYRDIDADFCLNGADAIQKIRLNKYDAVVLDLKLPGISGMETMRVIKGEQPAVPIILITGHGDSDFKEELPQGIFEYLQKPVKIETLMKHVRRAYESKIEGSMVAATFAEEGDFKSAKEIIDKEEKKK